MITRKIFVTSLLAVALAPSLCFAGKPERDKADELKTQFSELSNNVKTACGCPVTIDAKWDTFATADDMIRMLDTAKSFEQASSKYCQKPVDKESFCKNIEGLEISYAKEGMPALSGKKITAISSNYTYGTEDAMTKILNQF